MTASLSVAPSKIDRLLALPRRARQARLPWFPLVVMTVMLGSAVLAPLLAPHDPTEVRMLEAKLAPGENLSFPLGTDIMGRDMLSRLIYGARTAVFISLIALGTGAFVGTVLGLVAGFRTGLGGCGDHAGFRRRVGVSHYSGSDDHRHHPGSRD